MSCLSMKLVAVDGAYSEESAKGSGAVLELCMLDFVFPAVADEAAFEFLVSRLPLVAVLDWVDWVD